MSLPDPWAKSGLPAQEVAFLKEYFRLLDAETEKGAAKAWAECWTKDGEFVQGDRVVTGHHVLEDERLRVWALWPHLIHKVKRIYVDPNSPHSDVLVVAAYEINRPDGSLITRDTAAHFHLVREDGNVKIKTFDIYADGSPLVEIMIKP